MLTQNTYADYIRKQQNFKRMAVVHQDQEDDCHKGLVTDTCAFGVSRLPSIYLAAFRSLPNSKGSARRLRCLSMSQLPSRAKAFIPESCLRLTPRAERGSSVACSPCFSSFLTTFRNVEVSNKADSSSVLALAGLNTSGLFSQAELWQNCKTQYAV